MNQGVVFNIQSFTIHDGPGIRTEIFLKGCPLRCDWCGNPESLKRHREPGIFTSKCISENKCGSCKSVCPDKTMLEFKNGKLTSIDREKCNNCMACAKECPADAIREWGKLMSVDECMKEILKDKSYYERSGGGVTVSGGDPILQSDFVAELFQNCKDEGIHTCFESSFYGEWKNLEKVLPYTDLFISDIKHMDKNIHKRYTGVDNSKILENLKRLTKEKKDLILRIPVIPNVNDSMENIIKTADFILNELGNNVKVLQLLSFMRLGEEKYYSLGLPYKMKDINVDRESFQKHITEIATYFKSRGVNCVVGTKENN
ncbi:MAG: (2S)-3-sulfopropanediol dehydratase activating enzyme [Fusobacteriaceae bacterium]